MDRGPILLTGATGFIGQHVRSRAVARQIQLASFTGDMFDPVAVIRQVQE